MDIFYKLLASTKSPEHPDPTSPYGTSTDAEGEAVEEGLV
jgi:hypothetical protein